MIDASLRERLLRMAETDRATRTRLAADGSLFNGYHLEMRAVHEANADALEQVIAETGWPTEDRVGADGAEAAWLIVQHAISRPALCRAALAMLNQLAKTGEAPRWQAAYLDDRIRSFEGRPQLYGTQFDWDDEGEMSPKPIKDADRVDERRRAAGLEPLATVVARHRAACRPEHKPADLIRHRREADAFARSVGWRASSTGANG